ncbi:MAG: polysaccharide deacetylase family protein [Coriobacteriales bacterium]|nr:polysaccharide deacetylase family protein [Coriobacteriales bacterium]
MTEQTGKVLIGRHHKPVSDTPEVPKDSAEANEADFSDIAFGNLDHSNSSLPITSLDDLADTVINNGANGTNDNIAIDQIARVIEELKASQIQQSMPKKTAQTSPQIHHEVVDQLDNTNDLGPQVQQRIAPSYSRATAIEQPVADRPFRMRQLTETQVSPAVRPIELPGSETAYSRRALLGMAGATGLALAAGAFLVANKVIPLDGLLAALRLTEPTIDRRLPKFIDQRYAQYYFPVTKYAQGVWLDTEKVLFGKPGQTQQVKVAVGSEPVILDEADFFSTDENVATVDKTGIITAQGNGKCEIIAGLDKYVASCKVHVTDKWLAMTFDDGPTEYTWGLLDGLRERGVHVTFFILGFMLGGNMDNLLQTVAADGHEIGNHSYNHQGGVDVIASQLARTDELVSNILGYAPYLMRPPIGNLNSAMYNSGKPLILWSVDPLDWMYRNADTVYDNIMSDVFSGCVVLLHDLYPTSIEAGLRVIDTLAEQGYAFVTISELFDHPEPGSYYRIGPETPRSMTWENPNWLTLFPEVAGS